jgi:ABC-type glycerol-3-phosphate transport system substrate-binding protein
MRTRSTMGRRIANWILCAAWAIGGAAACRPILGSGATAVSRETPAAAPSPSESAAPKPTADLSSLTIWLPPSFRSDNNSPAGEIFTQRIEDYRAAHPGHDVVVRIKASTGAGGLRDSLAAAAAAAPDALPDLVALDQSNLHAAAIKGLIRPLSGMLPAEVWESAFPYARTLVVVDEQWYGIPFAGDAIVLAGTQMPYPSPRRWTDTGGWTSLLFAPLADSRALFLFFGYYAAGGTPMLSVADVRLDTASLTQTLSWLLAMQEEDVLTARSLQLDSFESSFLAIESVGDCSVTLYSVVSKASDYFIGYLPTPEGEPFSLATGWSWTMATADPVRQKPAAELMIWLSDPEFLAAWSAAQGVLPTTRPALELWAEGARRDLIAEISVRALPFPNDEILVFAGPVFSKAARRVLLEGILPLDSAKEAELAIHP